MSPDDAMAASTTVGVGSIARIVASVDPSRLIYGAVVSAGVLAVAGAHADSSVQLLAGLAVVLAIYCLAHVYADLLGGELSEPQETLRRRASVALRRESAVVLGGVPGFVAVLVASLFGATVSAATTVASWVIVALPAGVAALACWSSV